MEDLTTLSSDKHSPEHFQINMRQWDYYMMMQKLKNDALWCKSAKNLAICFIYEASINLWCNLTTLTKVYNDKLLYLCQFELVLVAGGPGPGHPRQQGGVQQERGAGQRQADTLAHLQHHSSKTALWQYYDSIMTALWHITTVLWQVTSLWQFYDSRLWQYYDSVLWQYYDR